jgi:hypothetical protein
VKKVGVKLVLEDNDKGNGDPWGKEMVTLFLSSFF